jgi:4-diphosphocytidyl-2-C-methyl-D-erythritol kinase
LPDRLTARAYAKINLGLRILRKRKDGYHDIETVFHRVNIYDEIGLGECPKITLVTNAPDLPSDEQNLCVKAAQLFQDACKVRHGVKLTLKKKIPVGAGFGGGSSDAAATLQALARFWKVQDSSEIIRDLALELGSDVPYFLNDGTAYATGRGEVLQYFTLSLPYWIVLGYPNLHVSTAWAYGESRVAPRGSEKLLKDVWLEHVAEPDKLKQLVSNDFEPLLLKTHREIGKVKQALYDSGAKFALMSGSGSGVFGFFSSQSVARNTARAMKTDYQVFVTPPHFHSLAE